MKLQLFIGFLFLFCSSCSVKDDLCAVYLCEAPLVNLKFKFTDTNNRDLIFSTNPVYSVNDLKVHTSLLSESIPFAVDSIDKNNRYILIPISNSQRLTLKLGNMSQDILDIETRYKEEGCCGNIEVLSIKLNQMIICTKCNNIQPIMLIK